MKKSTFRIVIVYCYEFVRVNMESKWVRIVRFSTFDKGEEGLHILRGGELIRNSGRLVFAVTLWKKRIRQTMEGVRGKEGAAPGNDSLRCRKFIIANSAAPADTKHRPVATARLDAVAITLHSTAITLTTHFLFFNFHFKKKRRKHRTLYIFKYVDSVYLIWEIFCFI